METDHATIIWNLDDDVLVAHWVELDARAQDGEQTIVHLRTAAALEHDTAYMVVIRGLNDQNGEPIQPSAALKALIGGEVTNAEDIELRRAAYNNYVDVAENHIGVDRDDIQALWSFHTASIESVIGPILSMRDDALQRIGDGLGCTINSDGVEVVIVEEKEPLGTGGAIANCMAAVRGNRFLVLNGDLITTVDIPGMIAQHEEDSRLAQLDIPLCGS